MPLRDDLLNAIPGDNPSGVDVRYDTSLLIYDKIKEARRADDSLAQGDWQRERKVADYLLAAKLAQEALAQKTKDLQLAAWLADAMLHLEGFGGFRGGLALCCGMIKNFWDTLYPPIEDGDLDLRVGPLEWLSTASEMPLKSAPLVKAGYGFLQYKESRVVGYEEQLKNDKERKARDERIAEGKLTPEAFDKAFVETPKAFYAQAEKDLDGCLLTLKELDQVCDEKFGSAGPSWGKLRTTLEEVRHQVHSLLDKKRETEPDPVEVPVADGSVDAGATSGQSATGGSPAAVPGITISVLTGSDPPDRREAIAAVAKAAALMRKVDPLNPAPYLMMRGLRWGELRAAPGLSEPRLLEAPSTELRQHVKRLALAKKWAELLDAAETAMSLPCSRAWLDLQRLVVAACTGLGEEYEPIASAIRSEVRNLLNDIPQLWNATLLDDTPAANVETKAWLEQLGTVPAPAATEPPKEGEPAAPAANGHNPPAWLPQTAEAYVLAKAALAAGQPEKAFEIMQKEIARQKSGRGKFQRTMQLVDLCVAAGKESIAQPLLDDLAERIETHKLDDWEDKEMVAAALAMLMRSSNRVKEDDSEKRKLFERICRLDPVRALSAE